MSWLDEEFEDKVSILTTACISPLSQRRIVAAQVVRAAYEGGYDDAAWEILATRRLLSEAVTELADLRGACEEAKT